MLLSLLCEPGESVLVPDITYPLFEFFAADTRVTLIPYRLNPENSWQVESGSLKPTPSTKAIIVVSPNNPTGSIVTDLAPFAALDLPLIVDEVFADFTVGPPVHLQAHHLPVPVFTLNGVSKMFALPGLKLGWIALNRAAAAWVFKRCLSQCQLSGARNGRDPLYGGASISTRLCSSGRTESAERV
jgi:aspartate/methionine/tyrosine aminotransferase